MKQVWQYIDNRWSQMMDNGGFLHFSYYFCVFEIVHNKKLEKNKSVILWFTINIYIFGPFPRFCHRAPKPLELPKW